MKNAKNKFSVMINDVNYTYKTTKDLFNQLRKKEDSTKESCEKTLDSANLATATAILACVINETRKTRVLPIKKEVTSFLFSLYGMDKTDSGKSAIYNRVNVIMYIIEQQKTLLLPIVETVDSVTVESIVNLANKATQKYKGVNEILRAVKASRKTPEKKANTEKSLVSINFDESIQLEDRIGILTEKMLEYLNTFDGDELKTRVDSIRLRLTRLLNGKQKTVLKASPKANQKVA